MANHPVFRWLLDTAQLWPAPASISSGHPVTSTEHWATGTASRALSVLPSEETAKVLRFIRPQDAKLKLGSYLLKHLAIVRSCGMPWSESCISVADNGKPCFNPPENAQEKIVQFNVSHHGTVVVLVGRTGPGARLGIDVVHVDWDKDRCKVARGGFENWVRIFEDVFSEREVADIVSTFPDTYTLENGTVINLKEVEERGGSYKVENEKLIVQMPDRTEQTISTETRLKARLRRFYTFWSLKEAYIKMTGEALMAEWLRELEFRNVRLSQTSQQLQSTGLWGGIVSGVEVWLRNVKESETRMEIQAFGEDYIISTAVEGDKGESPAAAGRFEPWKVLSLEEDVYPYTSKHEELKD
ncbi:MAG: hypothetical protein FRX48_04661 [Lasallia pustulata]|uniref:holo-[acyl-carrier-protein] synthase n=1 Tax=Lasallia pustulata TaxID=136370 RepID=A0A5M8PS07_9LECA|nr:MAG: hypothetical protein FRX48_04661 [Lasallia pustulata]